MTNHAPYTPVPELPNNGEPAGYDGFIIFDAPATFTWSYQDPDYGDFQSRADFRYRESADPGIGWTVSLTNVDTNTYSYTLPANTWVNGGIYEYQISVYDTAGLQSPWSASRFIAAIATPAAPTITSPVDASAQTDTPMSLTWTLPAGGSQDAYQVIRADSAAGLGVVYYDSGVVEHSSSGTRGGFGAVSGPVQVPLDVATARTDYVIVTYQIHGFWSLPAVVSIVVTILAPKVPLFTAVQVPGRPEVVVSIARTDGFIGWEATLFNDIYRDGVRIATGIPDGGYFTDLLAGAGPVEYTVHGVTASGAKTISY